MPQAEGRDATDLNQKKDDAESDDEEGTDDGASSRAADLQTLQACLVAKITALHAWIIAERWGIACHD